MYNTDVHDFQVFAPAKAVAELVVEGGLAVREADVLKSGFVAVQQLDDLRAEGNFVEAKTRKRVELREAVSEQVFEWMGGEA